MYSYEQDQSYFKGTFQDEITRRFKTTDARKAPYLKFINAIFEQQSKVKKVQETQLQNKQKKEKIVPDYVMPPSFYKENIENMEKALIDCKKTDKSGPLNFVCAPLVFEGQEKRR